MKILKDRIIKDGIIIDNRVIKVDSFVNHQVDTALMNKMANEIINRFKDNKIDKVLTIEASGIAFAYAIASLLNVNLVFAKKEKTSNIGNDDVYSAKVFSFTHNNENTIVVNKKYLKNNENILIVDDFLANGEALKGLISLVEQANANVIGCGIIIEKGFQDGGRFLRNKGYHIESLAIIKNIKDNQITFE
ncbi:MAG: xanthine phosphoribosyltransferase [Bacilli bacterium]|nr:xanthine phosphoribosyltransferase [Bacilli bacterium]